MVRFPFLPLLFGSVVVLMGATVLANRGFGVAALLVGGAVYCGAAVIILARIRSFHPHPRFGAANAVTLGRFAFVCVFAAVAAGFARGGALTATDTWALFAIGLCVFAADGIDGWLARRLGTASAFGARFDMETDAFLVLVLSLIAWQMGKAGGWILLSGAARYLYVGASVLCPALRRPLFPSARRKVVAVIQIGTLVALLAPAIVPPVSSALGLGALMLLLYSFAADIRQQLIDADVLTAAAE